jgi:hypothetical protein
LDRRYDTGEKNSMVIKGRKFNPKGVLWAQAGGFNAVDEKC